MGTRGYTQRRITVIGGSRTVSRVPRCAVANQTLVVNGAAIQIIAAKAAQIGPLGLCLQNVANLARVGTIAVPVRITIIVNEAKVRHQRMNTTSIKAEVFGAVEAVRITGVVVCFRWVIATSGRITFILGALVAVVAAQQATTLAGSVAALIAGGALVAVVTASAVALLRPYNLIGQALTLQTALSRVADVV
jgi:hypothetical protein